MDFRLTDEQLQIQQMVRDFAESEIKPHLAEWDEAGVTQKQEATFLRYSP